MSIFIIKNILFNFKINIFKREVSKFIYLLPLFKNSSIKRECSYFSWLFFIYVVYQLR